MKINLYELNQTNGGTDFSANDNAEVGIVNAVCHTYDLDSRGGSVGFDPTYDRIINNSKIEIKVSKHKTPFIEIAKGDGSITGLSISKSDLYMFVNPGAVKINGDWINMMKVRIVHTQELKNWITHMIEKHPDDYVEFKPSKLGKGSGGFYLEWSAVDDLFLLGFDYDLDAHGNIVFDTHKIIMPNNEYAFKVISNFIK